MKFKFHKAPVISFVRIVFLFVLMFSLPYMADAQCAMCNETARTSTSDNQENAEALNNGIVYLMTLPYILLGVIGFVWWRLRKQSRSRKTA